MNNKNSNIRTNVRTMALVAIDDWGCPVYKCLETGGLWKDLSFGDGEHPQLHSCGCLDDDPGRAISPDLEVKFRSRYYRDPHEHEYMLLDRLRQDCDYYLKNGRCEKRLYHGNPKLQIEAMLILWESFPQDKKPEWLTREEIMAYEKAMIG
jgi:hypothetical protein